MCRSSLPLLFYSSSYYFFFESMSAAVRASTSEREWHVQSWRARCESGVSTRRARPQIIKIIIINYLTTYQNSKNTSYNKNNNKNFHFFIYSRWQFFSSVFIIKIFKWKKKKNKETKGVLGWESRVASVCVWPSNVASPLRKQRRPNKQAYLRAQSMESFYQ